MNALERMEATGIIPVCVIEDAKDAAPTARAMLDGGVGVMEITFRSAAAADAIASVAEKVPDMLVGAGTVVTLAQCEQAVSSGARFIVTPGFDAEIAAWCIERSIPVIPGCVTPTEIMAAMRLGLRILKFFPADLYGGLAGMKALSGPFGDVRFVPTGGVNERNASEYIAAPFVFAVGGSFVCPKAEIAAGSFAKITELCVSARRNLLGFETAHIGINCENAVEAAQIGELLHDSFGFAVKEGSSSLFASTGVELMKQPYLGKNGHIAIRTNSMSIAVAELEKHGLRTAAGTEKFKNGRLTAVYLEDELAGFAVHLLQR